MKLFLYVAATVCAAFAAPQMNAPQTDWYTQIGFWHLQKDSLSGRSFLFHDARFDGAASGEATANVRYNKGFEGLTRFEARLTPGPAPAVAGLLVQNKQVTYYFFVDKEKTGNFLKISRWGKKQLATIFISPVSIPDTVPMRLSVKKDSLIVGAGKTIASITRPADFSGTQWIGFECLQGSVKVFEAAVASAGGEMKESFQNASLINLHLEKMFPPAK